MECIQYRHKLAVSSSSGNRSSSLSLRTSKNGMSIGCQPANPTRGQQVKSCTSCCIAVVIPHQIRRSCMHPDESIAFYYHWTMIREFSEIFLSCFLLILQVVKSRTSTKRNLLRAEEDQRADLGNLTQVNFREPHSPPHFQPHQASSSISADLRIAKEVKAV